MHAPLRREKFSFTNNDGETLAGLIERPVGQVRAWVLFAHCFTCSKNIGAATRISRYLATRGFGVLRFDFTGLGNSEGDFANTSFSSNIDDLLAAAEAMGESHGEPALLVGHSLGGAAVLAAAPHIDNCRAVATIGAPSEPAHVTHLFVDHGEQLAEQGKATLRLGGREFTVARQFIEDLERHALQEQLPELNRALLIMHSPVDDVVDIEHARRIYDSAQHPKSFISLEEADHLLSDPRDAEYVAELLSAWASRYLQEEIVEPEARPRVPGGQVLVVEREGYTQDIYSDRHFLVADEPTSAGGADLGMSPYELLLSGLGACTAMTLRMYAQHKSLPLQGVEVRLRHQRIHAKDCEDCESKTGMLDQIERDITLRGDFTPEQRERMLQIADRCPVHRTLHSEVKVRSRLVDET